MLRSVSVVASGALSTSRTVMALAISRPAASVTRGRIAGDGTPPFARMVSFRD
jgi:hypothetical protein